MDYLMTLSNDKWLVNNESKRMWKKSVVFIYKYYAGIRLKGPRKTTKEVRIAG